MPDDLSYDAALYHGLTGEEKADVVKPVPPPLDRDFAPVPAEALARKAELAGLGPNGHLTIQERLRRIEDKIFGTTGAQLPVPEEEVEENLHESMRPAPLMSGEPVVVEPAPAPYSPSNPRRI